MVHVKSVHDKMLNDSMSKYSIPQTEIIDIQSAALMIPGSDPDEPGLAPKRHWVPGPGASYDPQANIL